MKFRKMLAAFATALTFVAGLGGSAMAQDAGESTWERIKRTGEVRFAVFTNPPYFVKDPQTNEWSGSHVEMAKDVASELKVDLELVEVGGWSELVLALNSDKIDFAAGMNATPVRATAIDFAGPIYWVEWVAVNRNGFETVNWEDYNKPEVKMAVMSGSADQIVLEQNAPNAEQLHFKDLSQMILAVSSGRADAFTTTVLSSMIAKEKNPGLGNFVSPEPRSALPAYFGVRQEQDARWKNFLGWWAEWNNKLGHNERRMRENMIAYGGVSSIPDSVSFNE